MSSKVSPESLEFHFSCLTDPRVKRTQDHSFTDILMLSLCALLSGAETFVEFERFGKSKIEFLSTFLKLPNGIPSHDTFGRVFAALDPRQFSECFANWTDGLRNTVSEEIVAIDGKTLRRSHDRANGREAIHMVSAWARENGLVLGQIKVNDKSNEITAIPELLQRLNIAGCIVTIDAMGCQTKIAAEIAKGGGAYVLALKGNQSSLQDEVESYFEDMLAVDLVGAKFESKQTAEKGHGRVETRKYWITDEVEWLSNCKQWTNLRSIGMVESTRELQGQVTTERRFYICSIEANVETFARAVRGHWAIENSLHWSLDVSFNEDQCRVRMGHAAENFAILRHMALNLLKSDSTKKVGLKIKQKCAGWDHSYLLSLLAI